MRRYVLDPDRAMLERFNQSERDRLLPVWRRAAWRLRLAVLAGVVFSLWILAVCWEVHR